MEVLRLRKCLCGLCSLQTGSLVIGILCLIWNLFMVGGVAGALHSKTNAYDVLWGESDTKSYLNVAFIFSICQAISNILLLFGANEEKPFLLLQWLFVKTLSAIAFIVIVIMFKIKQRGTAVPIIIIIYLLVHTYILLVVFSYYQTLREKSRLPKVRESTEMCEVRQS